jgi:hypothetical protein
MKEKQYFCTDYAYCYTTHVRIRMRNLIHAGGEVSLGRGWRIRHIEKAFIERCLRLSETSQLSRNQSEQQPMNVLGMCKS